MRLDWITRTVCGVAIAAVVPVAAVLPIASVNAQTVGNALGQLASSKEVPLRIHARGSAAADQIRMVMDMSATGETQEAAEADLRRQEEQMVQELTGMGVERSDVVLSDIVFSEVEDPWAVEAWATEVVADAAVEQVVAPAEEPATPTSHWSATATATVTFSGSSQLGMMMAGEMREYGSGRDRPQFIYADEAKSRRDAAAKGMANARAEADAYAAAMGYKVVRVAGVSNAGSPLNSHDLLSMIARIDRASRDWSLLSEMEVPVTVDFILAPN